MWQDSGRPSQVGSLYRSAIGVMHISMFSPRGRAGWGGGRRGGGGDYRSESYKYEKIGLISSRFSG